MNWIQCLVRWLLLPCVGWGDGGPPMLGPPPCCTLAYPPPSFESANPDSTSTIPVSYCLWFRPVPSCVRWAGVKLDTGQGLPWWFLLHSSEAETDYQAKSKPGAVTSQETQQQQLQCKQQASQASSLKGSAPISANEAKHEPVEGPVAHSLSKET